MKSAILEIGTESLPARFLKPAISQLEHKAADLMKANRLAFERATAYGTPMRLALILAGVPEKSQPYQETFAGPPEQLLRDESGQFSATATGFAKSHGVLPQELTVVATAKGKRLAVQKDIAGESAAHIMARLFPQLIGMLEFPKSLEWEESRFRFARPIRSLLALYGKRVVRFELAGVRSGNKTRGLACMGTKPITVSDPDSYVRLLRDRCILVDIQERGQTLLRSLEGAVKKATGHLDKDAELLEQVVCLTEHPVAVLGHFNRAYLELPQELLTTVLKGQLKFFPVIGNDGKLVSDFLGVRDGISEGQKEVQEGYERVLEARLSDARFFFNRDKATRLADKHGKLQGVSFQKGLGSMKQKNERVQALAAWLCERLGQDYTLDIPAVEEISRRVYVDLVTEVVKEFPELQGTMGGIYARIDGLEERVALGLGEFYYPVAAKAPLPTHLEGCLVSLAGKIDTLAAMFAAGYKPTGSEDPFALRRVGNGVIRILLEKQISLALPELTREALKQVEGSLRTAGIGTEARFGAEVQRELDDFLWQRAENLFLERGYPIDEVRSVAGGGLDNLSRTFLRLSAVHALRPDPDFLPLAQAFKRASNILKQAGVGENGEIRPELLAETAEKDLFSALCRVEGDLRQKLSEGFFEEGLKLLVRIKPELDRFFEDVLVMAENETLKQNRLALIARLVRAFKSVADISLIQN